MEDKFEYAHSLINFFNELDHEQLKVLDAVIYSIGTDADPKASAAYYRGYIDNLRMVKYDHCVFCRGSFESEDEHRKHFEEKRTQTPIAAATKLNQGGTGTYL